jgi:hypothetical protein
MTAVPRLITRQPVRLHELLLACAWNSGAEPVWVRNRGRLNDVDSSRVRDESSKHIRHRVECLKALVRRHLQDGPCGIERTIDVETAWVLGCLCASSRPK